MDDTAEAWQQVESVRRDLATALDGIDTDQWDRPSWCEGWRIRDVVGHVLGNAEGAFVLHRALPGLLRHRMRIDAFLQFDGRQRGAASPDNLLRRLRDGAGGRYLPPGRKPADVLTDAIVHTQDIARPLGLNVHAPPTSLRTALAHSAPLKAPPVSRRPAGLSLQPTDVDWRWGAGPQVEGSAEDLLLAICGRAPAVQHLRGDGVQTLAARC